MSEKWLGEQWLLQSGVVIDSSIDTLLMYAYAQPAVAKVTLEIPQESIHHQVCYKLILHSIDYIKWMSLQKANAIKNPILKKAALLALAKAGAPINLESEIISHAKAYLPEMYEVKVEVINE